MTRFCLLTLHFVLLLGLSSAFSEERKLSEQIDFSTCGYKQSQVEIPFVLPMVFIEHKPGIDAGASIQQAIDHISNLELNADGFRGAVLVGPGVFEISSQLIIQKSGVVLRGSGPEQTVLRAVGADRRSLIRVLGQADYLVDQEVRSQVQDEVTQVGATQLTLEDVREFQMGQLIWITRESTTEWIQQLGMDRFGIAWKPGTRDVTWERKIIGISKDQQRVTLDAPLTTALNRTLSPTTVEAFSWPGRIENVGIENLKLVSHPTTEHRHDEDHAWMGITMENVKDAWVRQIEFHGFAGSAVALYETTKNITVKDCINLNPISEVGGHRREAFFTMGQQTLFIRCGSQKGRRDFSVGHGATGPNAFVGCEAEESLGASGTMGSWATGVLFDNVRLEGGIFSFENRFGKDQGAGWTAANCLIWQSTAARMQCSDPPGASNQAYGVWGEFSGTSRFEQRDEFVKPLSLFQAQLSKRVGAEQANQFLGPIGRRHVGATNPKYKQAEKFVQNSNLPALSVRAIVRKAQAREPIPSSPEGVQKLAYSIPIPEVTKKKSLILESGILKIDGQVLRGKRFNPIWWRGDTRPKDIERFGPALTRFVPGRIGTGFTDDLRQVARKLKSSGVQVVEHHHGLWYDRRRDDHNRFQRADAEVEAPFYEQPFARSGIGKAADGLSRYDLTKFNPWYWNRLKGFAAHCEKEGLILFNQHYFQHNVLEAGAHWADFPWRSANNINETDFPEPPPYTGDKRIFQAHLFYDIQQPKRKKLHRLYIRKHLENFRGKTNVLHSIGGEFTGPLAFVKLWIDTIVEWEKETKQDVFIVLSTTKDVQDAILQDPVRGKAISVIDIRYWWYTHEGKLYAPEGGKNLSPRQHQRQLMPKSPNADSKRRAVFEYRERYPDKAVLIDGAPL